MKKWIIYTLLVIFAATTASAQWWKLGFGEEEQVAEPQQQQMRRGPQGGQRSPMSEKKRVEMRAKHEKMKAEREAVEKLTEAARSEADPVKKEELISQLRTKLTEGAVKMHEMHGKRLEKAEAEVAKMKKRLTEAGKNIDQKVEEHLQKLLSGERPERPKGGPHRKGPKPPVE